MSGSMAGEWTGESTDSLLSSQSSLSKGFVEFAFGEHIGDTEGEASRGEADPSAAAVVIVAIVAVALGAFRAAGGGRRVGTTPAEVGGSAVTGGDAGGEECVEDTGEAGASVAETTGLGTGESAE